MVFDLVEGRRQVWWRHQRDPTPGLRLLLPTRASWTTTRGPAPRKGGTKTARGAVAARGFHPGL